jgi:hypothetical protein
MNLPAQTDNDTKYRSSLEWHYKGSTYQCVVRHTACPVCLSKGTITELPPPLRREQPDGTMMVCHPALGGCNTGFEPA